jgi:hypothetical protein
MKTKALVLIIASNIYAGDISYSSLFQQSDYENRVGFKNIASPTIINNSSNTFNFFVDESISSTSAYPRLNVITSNSIVTIPRNTRTLPSTGGETIIIDTNTTTSPTSDVMDDTSNQYWCSPDGWNKIKIYIPKGIKKLSINTVFISSVSELKFHIAFKPDSSNSITMDHVNFVDKKPAEIDMLTDLFINRKTIEVNNLGGFGLLNLSEDDVSNFSFITSGWLYVSALNNRAGYQMDVNRNRDFAESTQVYFKYSYTVDSTEYSNFYNSLTFDANGDPIDNATINEIDNSCSTTGTYTPTPTPTSTPIPTPTTTQTNFSNNSNIDLNQKGWHLLGAGESDLSISNVKSYITDSTKEANSIWSYQKGQWVNPTDTIERGYGFWIKVQDK